MFNWLKTSILMAGIVALFGAVGMVIGGERGMILALIFGGGMNLFSYWFSDKMVLRMYNAQEVDAASSPYLYNMVQELAARAGLPMPKVYLINEQQPNAFATGRNPEHAAVAATTGIIHMLSERELRGVMAHELAHVQHRDTLTMTVTATIAGAISMLANFGLFFGSMNRSSDNRSPLGGIGVIIAAIVAPLAAMLVQMAISRTREYAADRRGAEISGQPLALASALDKIAGAARHVPNMTAEQNPATAHLFIINPLSGARMDNLFSTHPDTGNRIRALMAMADEAGIRRPAEPATRGPWSAPRGPWDGGRSQGDGRPSNRGPWG